MTNLQLVLEQWSWTTWLFANFLQFTQKSKILEKFELLEKFKFQNERRFKLPENQKAESHLPPLANPRSETEHDVHGMENFHWPVWLSVWLRSLPAPAHLLISWIGETEKSPWFTAASEIINVINILLVLNPNTAATERKISSIPAKTRTKVHYLV